MAEPEPKTLFFPTPPRPQHCSMKTQLFLFLLVFLFIGCQGNERADGARAQAGSAGDASDQYFSGGADYAGSHILVAYQGAERANPEVTRTKEEALAKAKDLATQLQENPDQFEEMARQESDGPSGPNGGSLGSWQKGQMVAEFDTAVEQMEVGDITSEPVETDFGYHVIRREPTDVLHYSMQAFVIPFGDGGNPEAEIHTQEEARAIADGVKSEVTADNFEEMAHEYGEAGNEGLLFNVFAENDQRFPAALKAALEDLDYGEVAGPVELPNAYAYVKRFKVVQYSGAHILVAYQGAQNADPSITRTRDEAEARARELIGDLREDPGLFTSYAEANSDGPSSTGGGDLGVWFKGYMVPEFDAAVEQLEVGEITSEPVETDFGFHIVQRKAVSE